MCNIFHVYRSSGCIQPWILIATLKVVVLVSVGFVQLIIGFEEERAGNTNQSHILIGLACLTLAGKHNGKNINLLNAVLI